MNWFGPGNGDCGCCEAPADCHIFADTFDRSNSTDLGADWTEVIGDWSISDDLLRVSEYGLCVCTHPHPDSETRQIVQVKLLGQNNNDAGGIVCDYVDQNNYHYVEVTFREYPDVSTLTFWKNTPSLMIQLGDTRTIDAVLGNWATLKVCFRGDVIQAQFDGGEVYAEPTSECGGFVAGVQATVMEESFYFNDFDYDKHYSTTNPKCPECSGGGEGLPCNCCSEGTMPTLWLVKIEGIVDDTCTAGDCTLLNDSFIIDLTDFPDLNAFSHHDCASGFPPPCASCTGGGRLPFLVCSTWAPALNDVIIISLCSDNTTATPILICRIALVTSQITAEFHTFVKAFTSLPNCSELEDEELTFHDTVLSGGGSRKCNADSAKVYLTSL